MSSTQDPIAPLKDFSERAVGFCFNAWKRIQKAQEGFRSSKKTGPTVAVDLGHSHLLVLAAEKEAEKLRISTFHLELRPPSSPDGVSERLRAIFKENKLNPKGVCIALKGQGIVIRILTFPQMKKSQFASMIRYEVGKYIPFKPSEVLLDFQILKGGIQRGNSKLMEALLVAVRQSEVYDMLRLFQSADLEVELIDTSAFALANLVEFVSPQVKEIPIGFLDMGAEITTFGVLLSGKPIFIRDLSFGGVDILKLMKRKLGLEQEQALTVQGNPSLATSEYKEVLEAGFRAFLTELKVSLGYYIEHVTGAEPIQVLYVGGGGFRFLPDLKVLEEEIKIPVRRPDILSRIVIDPGIDESLLRKNEDLLAVAVGLCLR